VCADNYKELFRKVTGVIIASFPVKSNYYCPATLLADKYMRLIFILERIGVS